jgi:hypothetical protein
MHGVEASSDVVASVYLSSLACMWHVTSIKVLLDKFEELLLPYDSRPFCFTFKARD